MSTHMYIERGRSRRNKQWRAVKVAAAQKNKESFMELIRKLHKHLSPRNIQMRATAKKKIKN